MAQKIIFLEGDNIFTSAKKVKIFGKNSPIKASKYISNNNDFYSSGFFNSSLDKFTYYNSRKGFLDTDNYFKDPWDQRSLDDYIRYIHMPPVINHSEINTIYDRNR